jgi:hypothetical protein
MGLKVTNKNRNKVVKVVIEPIVEVEFYDSEVLDDVEWTKNPFAHIPYEIISSNKCTKTVDIVEQQVSDFGKYQLIAGIGLFLILVVALL